MYRRLIILSVIIFASLCGLGWLGYHSIRIKAEGMQDKRLGEFAQVAEQIRQDVKRKLDEFMQTEQNRPYTDYQYYYVPETVALQQQLMPRQQMPLLRSPLSNRLEHGLAYGHFQIEPGGKIITPNDDIEQRQAETDLDNELYAKALSNRLNIENNLLPVLNGLMLRSSKMETDKKVTAPVSAESKTLKHVELARSDVQKIEYAKSKESRSRRGKSYPIESFQKAPQQPQIITQQRSIVASNVAQSVEPGRQQAAFDSWAEQAELESAAEVDELAQVVEKESIDHDRQIYRARLGGEAGRLQPMDDVGVTNQLLSGSQADQYRQAQRGDQAEQAQTQAVQVDEMEELYVLERSGVEENQIETVQIRIEPFVPVVVGGGDAERSIFGGQVFLLRHIQIEERHFLQGFQLNEKKLVEEVQESAARFMREGMSFELSETENGGSAHTAILDFGFGDLVLNLREIDPGWIGKEISQLQNWYFSIVTVVLLAVTLGLVSLWRNARAQLKLAQKKDDFISAVSHELRTPLTSIRMYSEMLEKKWVKSEDKVGEYYRNMRQESERLSRLIENVLDFSRIQRGRKKYTFRVGDINECITEVVEMMRPYAAQTGFSIRTELEGAAQTAFDSDAVTQIVVNLLDNAIKYARDAEDKTITVRSRGEGGFILIEVEDHGPGVPHHQRKKIFEEFYRTEAEATRETVGTGLGLALVKKFAEAHNGFVEILAAKPTGSIFRVALAVQG